MKKELISGSAVVPFANLEEEKVKSCSIFNSKVYKNWSKLTMLPSALGFKASKPPDFLIFKFLLVPDEILEQELSRALMSPFRRNGSRQWR